MSASNGQHRLDVHRVGHERAVAQHDALGRARRAAGVEEPGEVVLGDVVGEVAASGAGEQRLVAVAGVDDVLDARRAGRPMSRSVNSIRAPESSSA